MLRILKWIRLYKIHRNSSHGSIMKSPVFTVPVLFLVLLCVIMISGCTSDTGSSAVTTVPTTLPPASEAPVSTPATLATPVVTPSQIPGVVANDSGTQYLTYTNPSNQLTMSYPSGWQEQDVAPATCWAVRNYGDNTCNIVNFFSPTVNGTYNTFSIDVDNPTSSTLETYFNKATASIENQYPGMRIIKTSFQEEISGNKAYELVYNQAQEGEIRIPAIEEVTFANTNVPYIISYTSLEDPTFDYMVKSIQIATAAPTKSR